MSQTYPIRELLDLLPLAIARELKQGQAAKMPSEFHSGTWYLTETHVEARDVAELATKIKRWTRNKGFVLLHREAIHVYEGGVYLHLAMVQNGEDLVLKHKINQSV